MNSVNMTLVDWLIVAILVISALISIKRGFVKEALSLAIWLVAFFVASTFSPLLAPILANYIDAASIQQMAAFAILFIATLLVGGGLNYLLATLIKVSGLSGTDRLLGVIFGAVRGGVIVMLLVIGLPKLLPVQEDLWWQQSAIIPHFVAFEDDFWRLSTTIYHSVKGLF